MATDNFASELHWEPDLAAATARAASAPVPGSVCLPLLVEQADRFCSNAWERSQGLTLPPFNIVHAVRLHGQLDLGAANSALGRLVSRHEALRVGFPDDGAAGYQVLYPAPGSLEFGYHDLSGRSADEREELAHELLREASTRRFDIASGLLIRGLIIALGDHEWILLLAVEHLTIDGQSFGLLLKDFSELYAAALEGREAGLADPETTYTQLVWGEIERCASAERLEALDYWRDRLRGIGVVPAVRLPMALRTTNDSYLGGFASAELDGDVVSGLWQMSEEQLITPFALVLAAFGAVLRRYGGGESFGHYVPVARRDDPARERLVGLLASHTIIPQDLSGDPTFAELAARTQDEVLDSLDYSDLPFTEVARRVNPGVVGRHREEPGLWCDISPATVVSGAYPGCTDEPYERQLQDFPVEMIGLFGSYSRDKLRLRLGFPADVYPADDMAGLFTYLTVLLTRAVGDPATPLRALYDAVDKEVGTLPGLP